MRKEKTLDKLQNAFTRLKEGQPLRINPRRKITPSSVEDEAGLPKSTLRNTPAYRTLFEEIVLYKNSQKNNKNKTSNVSKISSINNDVTELRKTNKELREKLNKKQKEIDFLVASNAELTSLLNQNVNSKRLEEFIRSQQSVVKINGD